MSIEVILKEHVEHLGRRGEVVKVASGYARNYLLPRKLALEVAIARRVGEHETLYGSVTSADLADALTERGLPIDRRRIQLPDPLKTLGDHEVAVKLHREVTARLRVKIVPAAD